MIAFCLVIFSNSKDKSQGVNLESNTKAFEKVLFSTCLPLFDHLEITSVSFLAWIGLSYPLFSRFPFVHGSRFLEISSFSLASSIGLNILFGTTKILWAPMI